MALCGKLTFGIEAAQRMNEKRLILKKREVGNDNE
jgi:hypothetical protein